MSNRIELIECPKPWATAAEDWLGHRAYRLSGDHPGAIASSWTSIVMSHRHRNPEQSAWWRLVVEESLRRCRATRSVLLASNETPLGTYLIQAARRARISTVLLQVPFRNESYVEWKDRISLFLQTQDVQYRSTQSIESTEQQISTLWISPLVAPTIAEANLDDGKSVQCAHDEFDSLPLVDRALIALADSVHVISVHPKSKTERLILKRLADQRFPVASVFVVFQSSIANEQETKSTSFGKEQAATSRPFNPTLNRLLDCGAVGWLPSLPHNQDRGDKHNSISHSESYPRFGSNEENPTTFVPRFRLKPQQGASPQAWRYLTHCTRARMGAWPDQSQVGYFDSLLAMNDTSELRVSPLETLKRILLQNRLIASQKLKRSNTPTVSLTEVPLQELLERRHFQSHIGRWDWEPYGICIDRSWLEKQGGRRVLYMNSSKWRDISPEEQPYFQPTNDALDPESTNWEIEKEWRFVGDIHLAEIPFESAFVFVPCQQEAEEIASISRFPILVLASESS